jgi:hypothetical protein
MRSYRIGRLGTAARLVMVLFVIVLGMWLAGWPLPT